MTEYPYLEAVCDPRHKRDAEAFEHNCDYHKQYDVDQYQTAIAELEEHMEECQGDSLSCGNFPRRVNIRDEDKALILATQSESKEVHGERMNCPPRLNEVRKGERLEDRRSYFRTNKDNEIEIDLQHPDVPTPDEVLSRGDIIAQDRLKGRWNAKKFKVARVEHNPLWGFEAYSIIAVKPDETLDVESWKDDKAYHLKNTIAQKDGMKNANVPSKEIIRVGKADDFQAGIDQFT